MSRNLLKYSTGPAVAASTGFVAMVKSILRHLKATFEIYILVFSYVGSAVSSFLGVSELKVLLIPIQATVGALAVGMVRDRLAGRVKDSQILFAGQDEPYRRLEEYVKANRVTEAIFIQYSGEQCKNLVSTILGVGAKVELYTQLPETAKKIGSAMQANRIVGQFRDSFSHWAGELSVYQCVPPVSIRAVRIDDKVLCVGLYTFEPEEGRPSYPSDKTAVSGHDRPTFFVRSGCPEYETLNGMFTDVLEKYRKSPGTKCVRP